MASTELTYCTFLRCMKISWDYAFKRLTSANWFVNGKVEGRTTKLTKFLPPPHCTVHTLQKYVGWKDSLFSQTFSWELDVCTFLRKPYMTTTFPIRKNKTISKLSQKNFDTPLTTPQVKIEFLCPTNRKSLYHGGTIIGKFWQHQNMKIDFIFSM